MERKDYEKMFYNIKNEILKEIRTLVPVNTVHYFKDTFFVRYVYGEVAHAEICAAVEVDNYEMVIFHVRGESCDKTDMVVGEDVFNYDPQTFLDILDNLTKEIREEKLSRLREIVKKNGGEMSFIGDFSFDGFLGGEYIENCYLASLRISDGEIIVRNIFEGDDYDNEEDFIPNDELDKILAYVEEKDEQRTFDLSAEQNAAVDEFIAASAKLAQVGVSLIRDNVNDDLYFINGKDVKQFGVNPDFVKGAKDITEIVKKARCVSCFLEAAFYSSDGEKIFVEMND